jgi:hypothetical protein
VIRLLGAVRGSDKRGKRSERSFIIYILTIIKIVTSKEAEKGRVKQGGDE